MCNFNKKNLVSIFFVLFVTSANVSTVSAQQPTSSYMQVEPARWTQEDVTLQQQYSTAFKEATNAQQQSIEECKTLLPNQRSVCITNVHLSYKEEMAAIRLKFKR